MKKFLFAIIALVLVGAMLLASCNASQGSNSNGSNGSDSVSNSNASQGSHASDNTTSEETVSSGSESSNSSSGTLSDDPHSEGTSSDASSANANESVTTSNGVSEDEPDPSYSEDSVANGMSQDNSIGNNSNASNGSNGNASQGSNSNGSTSSNNEVSNTGNQEHRHQYSKIVVPPTCTEQGYTKYICDTCRDSYVSDYTSKVKHNMVFNGSIDPTDTNRGKYMYSCSYGCGTTQNEEIYSYNEYAQLLVPYVLNSLNEYRAKEGAPAVKLSNKLTEHSQYRSKQITTNFEHSFADACKAAEATHYGVYYSECIDPIDGDVIPERWIGQAYGEVIQKGYIQPNQTVKSGKELQNDLEKAAESIIKAFWNSKAHKEILAELNTKYQTYVGIGIYKGYVCINLDLANQDDTGYQHCWYDNDFLANGGKFHQCYEYVKSGEPQFKCINPSHHK